ncbi:MAG TPA: hypothetical protein VLT33_35580 [Labilithrix sp.]|nr:hypothetical protein [Labilithrix sp.]
MTRTFNGLGFALATALVLVGCTFTSDGNGSNGSDGADGGPGSSDHPSGEARDGSAPSGELSFSPANVPADAGLVATGDWIFNTDTCGSTNVTIDTAKGTVSCKGQAKDAFTFKAITQVDTSQGTLTAGLFVTRRLVIEPSMVVDVVGNRPLVIVALDTAIIQGALRASAVDDHASGGGFDGSRTESRGAGPGGGQGAAARAGAGGGGHCGVGGGGSAGGKPYGTPGNTPLVGGGSGGSGLGYSGGGGGAVQVVAGTSIELSGTGSIGVSGGGGDWTRGGGGAGGAILLEAPSVSIFGALAANGGGGASGNTNKGANGSASADPAKGGPGTDMLGTGGDGSAGATIDGQNGTQPDPAQYQGGGGGGAGWIRLNTKSGSATIGATAVISPALSTPCATQGATAAR